MSNDWLAGLDAVVREDVVGVLERRRRQGAGTEQLRRELAGHWSPEQIDRALAELVAEGAVLSLKERWYLPRFTDWDVGSVQLMERGDALIRSGAAGEAGYFVRRRELAGARDGDTVLIKRLKRRRRRLETRLPEAKVARVVARRRRLLVGTLERERGRCRLLPFDPKVKATIEVAGGERLAADDYVVVELAADAPPGRAPLRARIVEVLGSPEVPGVDVEVILRHFDIPDEFPAAVLGQAEALPGDPRPDELRGREDLRGATVITIDGESARDFDDAISVDELPDGGFLLGVHIADVAHYVGEGSALDREAYRRGTSVYYPERAVPMLPERLSNGLCSLRPEVPRLTLSAFLTVGADGAVRQRRFAESVIRSSRRMTYAEVRRLLEEPRDGDRQQYGGPVLELLQRARRLMDRLLRRRLERGSIDFDLPEGDVILDSEGFTVGVRPGDRTVANRVIEEFMIAANEAVAAELAGHDSPALYRVHDPPSPEDLDELRLVLAGLGIRLQVDLEALHPRMLQDLLRRMDGRPEEPFVASMVLRAMRQAVYHPECRGHYALSSRHYLHFTSPIRRYPDLLVHRRLKRLLQDRPDDETRRLLLTRALPAIAEHCSRTERRAEQSERTLMQWKLVRFLAGRVGETFTGRITGVHPFGFFVQLADYFVDGLVALRALTDDEYVYDAESHQLVGRARRRRFRLADEVEVVLAGVDLRRRGLELRLPG